MNFIWIYLTFLDEDGRFPDFFVVGEQKLDLVVTESHEAASGDDFSVRIVQNQPGIWRKRWEYRCQFFVNSYDRPRGRIVGILSYCSYEREFMGTLDA